jgi:uncharacterized protein
MTRLEKKGIDRRTFLKTTGIGGSSLALSTGIAGKIMAAEAAEETSSNVIPKRVLGKTGVLVPILAMGGITDWITNPALLRAAVNMGVTYWDTADEYLNGKSELGIGQYFDKYPEDRKMIFLVTKCDAVNPEGMTKSLNASLERMKTDYVDLYFMHSLRSSELLTQEIKTWVEKNKKEGKIKSFGFSLHMNIAPIITHASTLGWIDAIMPSYNYRTMLNDDMKKSIDTCSKANTGLIAMKVMGMMSSQPESSEEQAAIKSFMNSGDTLEQAKLKAVWKDERIATACIGMYSLAVLKDNVAAATDNKQLSRRETEILHKLAENTCDHYCLGCMKCASVMGAGSRIPDVMRYMMYYNGYGERDYARGLFNKLPESLKKDLALKDYSQAEALCPQHINIGQAMKEAVRILG